MRQSLFRKYFSMCCSITLAGIVVLGVVFMVFAAQYFQEDKLGALEKNAEYAAQMSEKYIVSVDGQYQLANNTMLTSAWIPMAKALDADIYLANMSGEVLVCTHRSACNHMVYGIGEEILDEVRENGIYTEVGKMGEIYKSSYYTAGVPLTLSDGRLAGVVFASSSAQGLTDFMSEILRVFLLSVLVLMVVIFVLAYIVSGSLTRPLREMAKATEAFARGDFSVRVPVNERDEIGKLAMAFNNMADSLAQQETVRRSFIANVSHELKTPMTSIAGFIDGILDGTIPQEKERHYLTIVSDEVKRLSRMVRSMLNIAKIEAGEMKLKPTVFDVNEVVLSSIFTFEQMIEKKTSGHPRPGGRQGDGGGRRGPDPPGGLQPAGKRRQICQRGRLYRGQLYGGAEADLHPYQKFRRGHPEGGDLQGVRPVLQDRPLQKHGQDRCWSGAVHRAPDCQPASGRGHCAQRGGRILRVQLLGGDRAQGADQTAQAGRCP